MKRASLVAATLWLIGLSPALQQVGASRFALVTVSDPQGRPLVDVGADDFAVQESGAAREVLMVRPADYPLVLLIDTAAVTPVELTDMQRAATQFIARLGTDRAVAVAASSPPVLLSAFGDDRKVLIDRIGALQPTMASDLPRGITAAAQTAHAAGPLFAAVVVMAASPTSGAALSDALGAVVDNGVTLHVIEKAGGPDGSGGPGGSAGPGAISPLRQIVEQTQGEYARIYTSASYQAALGRLADRLTTELLIEYLVPVGSKPADVKLGVRVPGARVRGLGIAPR